MFLKEILDQLTYGELSQLSVGGGEAGVITDENIPRILVHINLGLTALYKRFNLKEGRITLALDNTLTSYPLTSKFAVSSNRSREPKRHILDSLAAPFTDDIIKVERVLTHYGVEFPLNIESEKYSVRTPVANTLVFHQDVVEMSSVLPEEYKTPTVDVVYRAAHPKIVKSLGLFDPSRIQVQLPDSHLNALLLFVASRAHNPVGMTGEFNAGNNYAMKYEQECQELEGKGLQINQDSTVDRLRSKGWV